MGPEGFGRSQYTIAVWAHPIRASNVRQALTVVTARQRLVVGTVRVPGESNDPAARVPVYNGTIASDILAGDLVQQSSELMVST
jgi:hypothetical protein